VRVLVQCRCSVHRRVGRSCCAALRSAAPAATCRMGIKKMHRKAGLGHCPGEPREGEQGPWCWDLGSGLSDWSRSLPHGSHCVATSRIRRWVRPPATPPPPFFLFFWATLETGRIRTRPKPSESTSPSFEVQRPGPDCTRLPKRTFLLTACFYGALTRYVSVAPDLRVRAVGRRLLV